MNHPARTALGRLASRAAAGLGLALLLMLLAAGPRPAMAQSCHALDGIWRLEPDKGNLGSGLSFNPYYAITGLRLTIRQQERQIVQQWEFSGPHLARTARYSFSVDGTRQPTGVTDPMDFEYVAVAAIWQNCTLVQTGYSRLFGMEVQTQNTYVISPDDAELDIVQYGESPISVIDRRLVLRRER
jgi:hypothetical protein